jgi:hypothetical protein
MAKRTGRYGASPVHEPWPLLIGASQHTLGADDLPLESDLYLLRDHRSSAAGYLTQAGQTAELLAAPDRAAIVLAASSAGLYVALPAGDSIERYHFEVRAMGTRKRPCHFRRCWLR